MTETEVDIAAVFAVAFVYWLGSRFEPSYCFKLASQNMVLALMTQEYRRGRKLTYGKPQD